jgi:hypothetical protein
MQTVLLSCSRPHAARFMLHSGLPGYGEAHGETVRLTQESHPSLA